MDHFPRTWLPIIAKHLRKHLCIPPDAPLPEGVQAALEQLRAAEMIRLSVGRS